MITRLTLRNFKSVGEQSYDFGQFDLLVGRNNSGKSTVLQALAIWQFCVDEFHHSRRDGSKGIQVILPNFTALPVPEFILLWKDRTDRGYPLDAETGKKRQEFILISIEVEWRNAEGQTEGFGVELRYHSPQTIYAIPAGGWARFRACEKRLPRIAYVPPFSGLEPTEIRMDISPLRKQVGKGQPGSVLRNLLLQVKNNDNADWQELASMVHRWFSVEISTPRYEPEKDVYIKVDYRQGSKAFDIIAGGSGFHQTLTLLAFLYGYRPDVILLDEPDAHLHVNLQREILDYFKRKSVELNTQFLIATHAEEFIRGVNASQILSLLNRAPSRISSKPEVIQAMAEVSNEEITRLQASPYILYVEGESDERILRAWAAACDAQDALDRVCFRTMDGGDKPTMKRLADEHFAALQQIIPEAKRLMLFDYDNNDKAFHPAADNPCLAEWKRQNIENYLLVPDAWKRAAMQQMGITESDLFSQPILQLIDGFFADQNLTLAPGRSWRSVVANIFAVLDGKRILFEAADSLFQQLRAQNLLLIREAVAMAMQPDELHEDVHQFMDKVRRMTGN